MGQSEPSANLGVDALDQLPIPVLRENDDLVVSELIAVRLICHTVSPFLIVTLRVSPETKKAQPI